MIQLITSLLLTSWDIQVLFESFFFKDETKKTQKTLVVFLELWEKPTLNLIIL